MGGKGPPISIESNIVVLSANINMDVLTAYIDELCMIS